MRHSSATAGVLAFLLPLFGLLSTAQAVSLEQVISREEPTFDVARARLTVGRDGMAYLCSGGNNSYLLRLSRDGKDKLGSAIVYAAHNATANAQGVIASANAHFGHKIRLYDKDFKGFAEVPDFLVSDQAGWDAPAHVEAGPSGDFYGIDQHRDRILRIDPAGHVLRAYAIPHEPDAGQGLVHDFRVNEKLEALYVLSNASTLRCIGFDGKKRWELRPGVSGSTWEGTSGGWDVDDAGILYVIDRQGQAVKKFSPDGQPAGEIKLVGRANLHADSAKAPIIGLRVWGQDIVIKRSIATELFETYDLATGALRTVVRSAHERLAAEFPSEVWTACDSVDFRVSFENGQGDILPFPGIPLLAASAMAPGGEPGPGTRPSKNLGVAPRISAFHVGATLKLLLERAFGKRQQAEEAPVPPTGKAECPRFRVWARPFHDVDYRELALEGGKLQVPSDLAGLYLIKVTPETQPLLCGTPPEYMVRTVVEIRQPGTKGYVAAMTEHNRLWFGANDPRANDTIPVSLLVRAPEGGKTVSVTVRFTDGKTTYAEKKIGVTLPPKPGEAKPANKLGPPWPFAKVTLPPKRGEAKSGTGAAFAAGCEGAARIEFANLAHAGLRPGRYWIEPSCPGMTCVRQGIELRPGGGSWLWRIQYGDYGETFPTGSVWEAPEVVAGDLARRLKLGFDLMVDRLGHPLQTGHLDENAWRRVAADVADIRKRLEADPLAVPPEKLDVAPAFLQTMAAYSANGLDEMAILMGNDAGLPLGSGYDNRKPEQLVEAIKTVTNALNSFPAFSGWIWASNWWIFDQRGSRAAKTPDEKAAYEAALKQAKETGKWDPILDKVSGDRLGYAVEAQELFNKTLGKFPTSFLTASACPFRNVESYPPISLSNVDLADLQAQWEQIAVPFHAPYAVDFYGRGKTALGHPEIWNDCGTGDQIIPTLMMMIMRGAGSVGCSGRVPPWTFPDTLPDDPRSAHYGTSSAFRAFNQLLGWQAGLFLSKWFGELVALTWDMRKDDPVALVASGRMFKIDEWGQTVMGTHFARLFEAYIACMAAHYPASVVFAEDTKPETLNRFKIVLVVGQRVEIEPQLAEALKNAQAAGVAVFYDGTCRPELVKDFKPLGVSFDQVEKDPNAAGDDSAYLRYRDYARKNLPSLKAAFRAVTPPIAEIESDEILVSQRKDGHNRYLVVVNNTMPDLRIGQMWRMNLFLTNRVPVEVPIRLAADGMTVFDVFAGRPLRAQNGSFVADLRSLPARVFAIVPAREARRMEREVKGELSESLFGPHVRDLAVADDGRLIVANAMNWDHNLYAVRASDGEVRWRQRAGGYFAFSPQAAGSGFAVQGFDFDAAEGYHLYLGDRRGNLERRFALYGLPKRLPHRFVPGILRDRINSFAVPEDGSWVASAGDLGLAVWARDGKLLWSQDWWKTERHTARLAALGKDALLAVEGMKATAYAVSLATGTLKQELERGTPANKGETRVPRPSSDLGVRGKALWSVELARAGEVTDIRLSGDGKTLALLATTEGGRVFVLREGKLAAALPTAANDACLSSDGSRIAVVKTNQLKLYSVVGGLQWIFSGDDNLRFPRFSPDDQRLVTTSDIGSVFVLDSNGKQLFEKDMGARAVPAWLPRGDLVLATWMGTVCRLDSRYREVWRTLLRPARSDQSGRGLPTARIASWGNAEPTPAPITPNLLAQTKAFIRFVPTSGWGGWAELMHDPALFYDGKPDPPPTPWIAWDKVGFFAETSEFNTLLIDTFRTQVRLTGITLFEDPKTPESWLRDAAIEWWDAAKEQWMPGADLLSDAAVHTHKFARPFEAARFRLVMPKGLCGNLCLGEIVFHGEALGNSHPDVIAKRPVAVLFDDGEDLARSLVQPQQGCSFKLEGAYSGGRFISLDRAVSVFPTYAPPFGHAIPNWDFEIAEDPQPGQYRYLQFAWRATAPETKSIALRIGRGHNSDAVDVVAGELAPTAGVLVRRVADAPPREWAVVSVDLWDVFKKPVRIQAMGMISAGGGAAFDQILLKRTTEAVPPVKK